MIVSELLENEDVPQLRANIARVIGYRSPDKITSEIILGWLFREYWQLTTRRKQVYEMAKKAGWKFPSDMITKFVLTEYRAAYTTTHGEHNAKLDFRTNFQKFKQIMGADLSDEVISAVEKGTKGST